MGMKIALQNQQVSRCDPIPVPPFVTLGTLLAMKRQAARPQDLIDITALEEAKKMREAGRDEQG